MSNDNMNNRFHLRATLANTSYICFAIFIVVWITLILAIIATRLLKNCSWQQNRELLMWIRIALRTVCSNTEASSAQTAELHPSTLPYE